MKNLEFFKNLSIGRYIDTDSAVHKLAPATKYLWLLALLVPATTARNHTAALYVLALGLVFSLLARIRPGYLLRGITPTIPLFAFAALLQVLFTSPSDTSPILVALGPCSVTAQEAWTVLGMAARFIALMLTLGLFTSVITEGDTARGIEDLLSPLARVGFPAHSAALAVAVAFRFIPIMAGELESVVKAQAARGADFGSGRGGPLRKARAYLPLVVPITIRALERAEALAEAMDARCYRALGRTRYKESPHGATDAVARGLAILVCVLLFVL